jgi:hypothetical protein
MIDEINWTLRGDKNAGEVVQHFTQCDEKHEEAIHQHLNLVLDRAIGIIPQSIHDDARYLLFTWNSDSATLDIVSTNDDKTHDASENVQLHIEQWQQTTGQSLTEQSLTEQTDNIHFWIKDYLTTCSEFLHFSLVAMLSLGDRAKTQLL